MKNCYLGEINELSPIEISTQVFSNPRATIFL